MERRHSCRRVLCSPQAEAWRLGVKLRHHHKHGSGSRFEMTASGAHFTARPCFLIPLGNRSPSPA